MAASGIRWHLGPFRAQRTEASECATHSDFSLQKDRSIQSPSPSVEVHAQGGYSRFGRNCTIYRTDTTCLIVDVGLRFEDQQNGPRTVEALSDLDSSHFAKYTAIVITHGHDDHIGSLPYLMQNVSFPIYATKFTIELIRHRFQYAQTPMPEIIEVDWRKPVKIGDAEVQFFQMSHSIPEAFALYIKLGGQKIFHSGDFKFDFGEGSHFFSSIDGLRKLGNEGVDALVCDSTNATVPGYCPSEEVVTAATLRILKASRKRTFVATFSSHVHRVVNLSSGAKRLGYMPVLGSKTIASYVSFAVRAGQISDQTLADQLLNTYDRNSPTDKDSLIFISGTQGEPGSGMMQFAHGTHPRFTLSRDDRVIISARTIPGNETEVRLLVDKLRQSGCQIITTRDEPAIHVSGHGCAGDIQLLAELLRPTHYLPMHGDTRMQFAGVKLLAGNAVSDENCLVISEGTGVRLNGEGFSRIASKPCVAGPIDDGPKVVLSEQDQKERRLVSSSGCLIGNACFDLTSRQWLLPFTTLPIGLSWLNDDLLLSFEKSVHERLDHEIMQNRVVDPVFLSRIAEEQLERLLQKQLRSRAVVRCRIVFQTENS